MMRRLAMKNLLLVLLSARVVVSASIPNEQRESVARKIVLDASISSSLSNAPTEEGPSSATLSSLSTTIGTATVHTNCHGLIVVSVLVQIPKSTTPTADDLSPSLHHHLLDEDKTDDQDIMSSILSQYDWTVTVAEVPSLPTSSPQQPNDKASLQQQHTAAPSATKHLHSDDAAAQDSLDALIYISQPIDFQPNGTRSQDLSYYVAVASCSFVIPLEPPALRVEKEDRSEKRIRHLAEQHATRTFVVSLWRNPADNETFWSNEQQHPQLLTRRLATLPRRAHSQQQTVDPVAKVTLEYTLPLADKTRFEKKKNSHHKNSESTSSSWDGILFWGMFWYGTLTTFGWRGYQYYRSKRDQYVVPQSQPTKEKAEEESNAIEHPQLSADVAHPAAAPQRPLVEHPEVDSRQSTGGHEEGGNNQVENLSTAMTNHLSMIVPPPQPLEETNLRHEGQDQAVYMEIDPPTLPHFHVPGTEQNAHSKADLEEIQQHEMDVKQEEQDRNDINLDQEGNKAAETHEAVAPEQILQQPTRMDKVQEDILSNGGKRDGAESMDISDQEEITEAAVTTSDIRDSLEAQGLQSNFSTHDEAMPQEENGGEDRGAHARSLKSSQIDWDDQAIKRHSSDAGQKTCFESRGEKEIVEQPNSERVAIHSSTPEQLMLATGNDLGIVGNGDSKGLNTWKRDELVEEAGRVEPDYEECQQTLSDASGVNPETADKESISDHCPTLPLDKGTPVVNHTKKSKWASSHEQKEMTQSEGALLTNASFDRFFRAQNDPDSQPAVDLDAESDESDPPFYFRRGTEILTQFSVETRRQQSQTQEEDIGLPKVSLGVASESFKSTEPSAVATNREILHLNKEETVDQIPRLNENATNVLNLPGRDAIQSDGERSYESTLPSDSDYQSEDDQLDFPTNNGEEYEEFNSLSAKDDRNRDENDGASARMRNASTSHPGARTSNSKGFSDYEPNGVGFGESLTPPPTSPQDSHEPASPRKRRHTDDEGESVVDLTVDESSLDHSPLLKIGEKRPYQRTSIVADHIPSNSLQSTSRQFIRDSVWNVAKESESSRSLIPKTIALALPPKKKMRTKSKCQIRNEVTNGIA